MGSPAQSKENEQLLASIPADLYRYNLLGKTLSSLKLQPFPILPIPFPCFIFLLSTYTYHTVYFTPLSSPLLGCKDKDFCFIHCFSLSPKIVPGTQ